MLSLMPPTLAPNIEPHIVLPTVSPEVMNDIVNAKADDPLPLVDIPSGDVKVEGTPPLVVTPTNAHPTVELVVVSIDHQEHFTTKIMFSTQDNLLGWV